MREVAAVNVTALLLAVCFVWMGYRQRLAARTAGVARESGLGT
ncbi:hypothetical protein [Microbulbifer rhizosphaerae]|uniref:Uncharacterized protein n=1 Tax=Microbulbifer rhizosphaerae TaxID=1562603 RepID=A0A7W4Z8G6_9GAMM|nr:hypothetical protein [Microbulbifer rhizosphaerae]MBB3060552.1 hypothetical protein [Microbulbifer rhizosphaerae]